MITTEREFSKLCTSRGFARLATRFYARCIGDGVYQTIYTGFREYVDPPPANGSATSRKSYYISVGILSIYSNHQEFMFIPGRAPGNRPSQLLSKSRHIGMFNGIEEEYAIMETAGFDILDTVDTQEAMLDLYEKIEVCDDGEVIHDLALAEPFLLCGRQKDAKIEISTSIAHCVSVYDSYTSRVEAGMQARDASYEQRIRDDLAHMMVLWNLCLGKRDPEIDEYIAENYHRNLAWIRKYGVPTHQMTAQRHLPQQYQIRQTPKTWADFASK